MYNHIPNFYKSPLSFIFSSTTVPLLGYTQSHFYQTDYQIIPSLFPHKKRLLEHLMGPKGNESSQDTRWASSGIWKMENHQGLQFLSLDILFCMVFYVCFFLYKKEISYVD